MALAEFDLIKQIFASYRPRHPYNRLGIGDDCALLKIPEGYQLALTTDTMVENIHFFPDVDPEALGHKILAVNLSDLAAMAAEPFAVSLAISLPKIDPDWLQRFAKGFFSLASQFGVDLIGGDTTAGPLSLTVQALGVIPDGKALLRSAAKVGDLIYVTGQIGNAGLGLKIIQGYQCINSDYALTCFHKPQPRIREGLIIRNYAHACIDISDGLLADLNHILEASGLGACLYYENIPLSKEVKDYIKLSGDSFMPLNAGDDYELCFTIPAQHQDQLPASCQLIGIIEQQTGLRLLKDQQLQTIKAKGYEHFS